jgi:DNA-3-methyladenine glycosylase
VGGRPRRTPLASLVDQLAGPVEDAARALLGCTVSAHGASVRLTEVEAYAGLVDPASHAYKGQTTRNAIMFGPAGFAYVYFTYGMHWCLNVVTGPVGVASAVLLRAGEVVDGLELARSRRGGVRDRDLARGPARLCEALAIDRSAYGTSLVDGRGPITLALPVRAVSADQIHCGPRVGVTGAHDVPWRFWLAGDPTVSTYRRHVPRPRRLT